MIITMTIGPLWLILIARSFFVIVLRAVAVIATLITILTLLVLISDLTSATRFGLFSYTRRSFCCIYVYVYTYRYRNQDSEQFTDQGLE